MHVEHQHHRRARNEVVGDLEANTNSHGRSRLLPRKSTQTINPENVLASKAGCDTGLWGSAPVTFSVALQHDFATTLGGLIMNLNAVDLGVIRLTNLCLTIY